MGMERSRASLAGAQADVELGSEHLVEDPETRDQRASLLNAAANAQNVATLTGTHGVVAMPLERATIRWPSPAAVVGKDTFEPAEGELPLTTLVRAHVASLEASDDAVARSRAWLELALAKLEEDDVTGAKEAATHAMKLTEHAPAVRAMLRALADRRAALDEQLVHVDDLVGHVEGATARADHLVERARLLEAKDGPSEASVAAYGEALALVVDHAGALEGLEAALESLGLWDAFATHLGRLAGLAGDKESVAWFLVERAIVLDRRLGDVASSRALLERAVELDPRIGPVRSVAVDHAVRHRDDARLSALLEGEAELEGDPARAVGLWLDAALHGLRAGGDVDRAVRILERAHRRAPTVASLDARVADELARIHEESGAFADALRVRKAALRVGLDAREESLALRAVADVAEKAGALDEAIVALERARVVDPDDGTLLEELDRVLVAAGRHEARAVAWVRESAQTNDPVQKARALAVSAEAFRAAGRQAEALKQLQSAWMTAPGAPGVFEALVERVPSVAGASAVAERVGLYERAANLAEPRKKIHHLEKLAWIWDDVVGDARRAIEAYEDILAIEPTRASAISGLSSVAARSGDHARLARALLAEVAITEDARGRAELRLRAAEALAKVEPEKSLVLAEELAGDEHVARRAGELVTRLHATANRWELAQASLASRARREEEGARKTALVLARAAMLRSKLGSPERAFEALDELREEASSDPAVARARLDALVAIGDEDHQVAELEKLAAIGTPEGRAARLVLAAEIEEGREGRDAEAARLYVAARALVPDEPLVRERLSRLGARADVPVHVPADAATMLSRALRWLDTDADEVPDVEPLLARGAGDVATLRIVERMSRRTRSTPQLANTLALAAKRTEGVLARRALHGLRALVTWKLPESDDLEPWEELLRKGTTDVVVLDDLVARARGRVRRADAGAIALSIEATSLRLGLAAPGAVTERIVLGLALARLERLAGRPREAAAHLRAVLAADVSCIGAAAMLAEIASEAGERTWAIEAARALADATADRHARAALLRDAADLAVAERDFAGAADALERALASDPEDVLVAARLAQVQLSRSAHEDLARALRRGIHAAKTPEAVVPMASELAEVARRWLGDPLLAIEALERSREVAPSHLPSLFLLAELYIGQRAWEKALDALGGVVAHATEPGEKLTGLVGRASIFRRALGDPRSAEGELRAALAIDPHDRKALRGLIELKTVVPAEERAELLSRFAGFEEDASVRLASLFELAEVRRSLNDVPGAEMALVEAAALSPDAVMLERLRCFHADAEGRARLLSRAIARVRESGTRVDAAWLTALADTELSSGRFDEAKVHLEEAVELEPTKSAPRLVLARGFAERGRYAPAVDVLLPLLMEPSAPVDPDVVRALGDAFARTGRIAEARALAEVRAVMGDRDPSLRASLEAPHGALHGADGVLASCLRSFVVPRLGEHPFLDVASLAASMAGKIARIPLADRGATAKQRLKPRVPHPLRQLVDHVARCFDLVDVELAVSEELVVPALAVEDVPWLVVPSDLADGPEARATAMLAPPLVRLALGLPWRGSAVSSDAFASVVALGRLVVPGFESGVEADVEARVPQADARVRRALDRKRRKLLEDLAPALAHAPLLTESSFALAVAQTEARTAFLLSGDLRAAFDIVASFDAPLGSALREARPAVLDALLAHPVTRDLLAFALRPETVALRRNLGTL